MAEENGMGIGIVASWKSSATVLGKIIGLDAARRNVSVAPKYHRGSQCLSINKKPIAYWWTDQELQADTSRNGRLISARIGLSTLMRPVIILSSARSSPHSRTHSMPALSEKALRSPERMRKAPALEISFALAAAICSSLSPGNLTNGYIRVHV